MCFFTTVYNNVKCLIIKLFYISGLYSSFRSISITSPTFFSSASLGTLHREIMKHKTMTKNGIQKVMKCSLMERCETSISICCTKSSTFYFFRKTQKGKHIQYTQLGSEKCTICNCSWFVAQKISANLAF